MTTNQLIQKLINAVVNESYADYEIDNLSISSKSITLKHKKSNQKITISL